MDLPERRPPRASRPSQSQQQAQQRQQSYFDQGYSSGRPPLSPQDHRGVSFQNTELGDRNAQVDSQRQRALYQNQLSPGLDDVEYGGLDPARVGRKKSLVKPDREKIEPGHRQWHYRTRVAQAEEEGARVEVHPSSAYFSSNLLPDLDLISV